MVDNAREGAYRAQQPRRRRIAPTATNTGEVTAIALLAQMTSGQARESAKRRDVSTQRHHSESGQHLFNGPSRLRLLQNPRNSTFKPALKRPSEAQTSLPLPPELVQAIFTSLPRCRDALALALTSKSMHCAFVEV